MGYKLNEKYFFLLWWRQWVWQRTEREREIRFLHFFAEMLKYRFCSCFQYFFSYFVMLILFFFKIFFFNIVYLDFFNFFSLNFTRKINICAFNHFSSFFCRKKFDVKFLLCNKSNFENFEESITWRKKVFAFNRMTTTEYNSTTWYDIIWYNMI